MNVEESLNVTFDETPPLPKTSPLEDDELVEEEAIEGRIEAIDSDGHLRSCPFSLGGVDELLELGYALGRHKVDIACFQETKWKGSITWEGNGYKLWYSGSRTARNGVGVILAARLKDKIVQVKRSSDMIMTISVVIEGDTISVISAYAPHVGLSDVEKKSFWDALDELVRECPPDERLIIGGDLNGYIGSVTDEYAGVHKGYGFEVWNEEGVTSEHVRTAGPFQVRHAHRNTDWDTVETFRATIYDKLSALREGMSACNVDRIEEVQTKVAAKQSRFKELLACREGTQEDIDMANERYKVAKREAKTVVAQAKDKAYEDLYKKLDFKKGANYIYMTTKA
ncbi:retrovirus-related pol polyprotein LINE-1 [Tanacetum coccineum]